MSFQMVLLLAVARHDVAVVLELCHSRWFYYGLRHFRRRMSVLELCHSRWFYYRCSRHGEKETVLELCHSRWFYYYDEAIAAFAELGD